MSDRWEKLPNETAKSFRAFAAYRDAGPARSLAKLARERGWSVSGLEEWSAKFDWVRRAEAWDSHLDRVAREKAEQAWADMKARHARLGASLVGFGQDELDALRRRLKNARGDAKALRLNAREIAALVEVGARLERLTLAEDAGKDAEADRAAGGGLAVVMMPGEAKDPAEWSKKHPPPASTPPPEE